MFGVFSAMFGSGMFWFTALLLITLAVLPDLTVRAYHDMNDPVYRYIARDKASRSTRSTPSKHVSYNDGEERNSACWNVIKNSNNKVAAEDNSMELQILKAELA